jgi:hypothetical protein
VVAGFKATISPAGAARLAELLTVEDDGDGEQEQ